MKREREERECVRIIPYTNRGKPSKQHTHRSCPRWSNARLVTPRERRERVCVRERVKREERERWERERVERGRRERERRESVCERER